eukprot:1288854-Pyramimonas_sp.AAC.1
MLGSFAAMAVRRGRRRLPGEQGRRRPGLRHRQASGTLRLATTDTGAGLLPAKAQCRGQAAAGVAML